jgi:predicted nucleic acid-binding protein
MKKMINKPAVYDTRFFVESFRTQDQALREKIKVEKLRKKRYVSAVVIHELYNTVIANEGRQVAKNKVAYLMQEFEVIPVDSQIAQVSAELRHKYNLSMGDSMIAATAFNLKAMCISDDPHFKNIKEIETTWI